MIDLMKLKTEELEALVVYKDVLNKKDIRFPKDFWTNEKYQISGIKPKSRVLTRYCLEDLAKLKISDLPKYNLKQLKSILIRGKLFGMVQAVFYHDVLAILKNAYPQQFKDRTLKEWLWSKHGLWHDDTLIIEAVKDMIKQEGIRRIEDIPSLDWKKRLLDYGIYNVLSYFNWSIYALFNFVYPDKFHPADFKYKIKWKASESLENSFYFMHKAFKKKRYTLDDVLTLGTADFRGLGLAGMLMSMFDSSTLRAKEYYLYKTLDDEKNQQEIVSDINNLIHKRRDERILNRLKKVAVGKFIYNLHSNPTEYGFIKRYARNNDMTIDEFISRYGFVYKSADKDAQELDPQEIWDLRRKRFTYIQIAEQLGSNPTTVSEICLKHFGGDPLVPRPIEEYITVQEIMDTYHIDHKTVMKLVKENDFENHMTIRLRYLNKKEIIPAVKKHIKANKQHQAMVKRYSKGNFG